MDIKYQLAEEAHIPLIVKAGAKIFDHPVKPSLLSEFIKDKRHHLLLAIHKNQVVGFSSGIHYIHPDKKPQLFINEVSVQDQFQGKGIGRALVGKLVQYGKILGCTEAWVGTELTNTAARKAYKAAGGKETDEFILIEF